MEKSQYNRPVESPDNVSNVPGKRVFSSLSSAVKSIFAMVSLQEAGRINRAARLKSRMEEILALYKVGRYRQGVAEFQQLYEVEMRELGDSHRTTLTIRHNTALGLENFDAEQAQSIYQEVLLSRQASDDPDTADTMHALARMNQISGNLKNARGLYDAALKLRISLLGWEGIETLRTAEDLIRVLILQRRDLPEAQRLCNEVLQRLPEHSNSVFTLTKLQERLDGMLQERLVFEKALQLAKLKQRDGSMNSGKSCRNGPDSEEFGAFGMTKALAYGECELGMDHLDVIPIVELFAELPQNAENHSEREDLYIRVDI